MLLPAFFSYAFSRPAVLMVRTGVFYLGLITTLVPLGVLAGTVGAFVAENRGTIVVVASIVVIVLGSVMALNVPLPLLSSRSTEPGDGTSWLAVYSLGTVYGVAGVCAGPLLGAVLTLAGLGGSALYGGVVLLIFAVGMVLPLLLLAFVWSRLPPVRRLVRPRELRIGRLRTTWTGLIGGVLTIGVGVLLLVTRGTASLGGLVGATDQMMLEAGAWRWASGVPDAVVLVVAVALAGAAWGGSRVLRRR